MKSFFLGLFFMVILVVGSLPTENNCDDGSKYDIDHSFNNQVDTINTWSIFIEALIWVESKGDEKAIGANDDVGVLQIRPIMVAEANRITGYDKYTLEDRFSRDKSIEMWQVVQDYHNPEKDIEEALKWHNRYAPKQYVVDVFSKYNDLLLEQNHVVAK